MKKVYLESDGNGQAYVLNQKVAFFAFDRKELDWLLALIPKDDGFKNQVTEAMGILDGKSDE